MKLGHFRQLGSYLRGFYLCLQKKRKNVKDKTSFEREMKLQQ